MTVEDFLGELSRASGPGSWTAMPGGLIRRVLPGDAYASMLCPIIFVHRSRGRGRLHNALWAEAAIDLGLSRSDARQIVMASDDAPMHDSELRLRIRLAAGLKVLDGDPGAVGGCGR